MLRFLAFLVLLFHAEKSAFAQATDSTMYKMAMAKLGANISLAANHEGSFILYTKEEENEANNLPVVRYLVIRSFDKKIIEEGAVTLGQVAWSGPYEIEISPRSGQVHLSRDTHASVKKIDLQRHLKNLIPK